MKTKQEIQIEKLKAEVASTNAELKQLRYALGDWNYQCLLEWKPNQTDIEIFKKFGLRE